MQLEKRRQFIINFLYFAIILGIVILLARYALGVLMLFLIALIIAFLLKPAVAYLNTKVKLPRGVAGIVLVVVFYALLGLLFTVLGVQLFSAAKSFFLTLPSLYTNSIVPWLHKAFDSLQEFVGHLDPDATASYNVIAEKVTKSVGDAVVTVSKSVVEWVTSSTLKAPKLLLNLLIMVIMVISTIFLTVDFPKNQAFVMRQLTPHWRSLLHNARVQLGRTIWSYVRSYAMILVITFTEIFIGLSIIGIDNAAGIAIAIAIFDILPVVGSGLVLLPWTIYTLISGNLAAGIGLGVLYVVVIVVRQIMEPKIVGDRVGLHPIVTLLSMVLGSYLFGGIGLLGLPITIALIHALNKEGAIHLYKMSDDEPNTEADEYEATPPDQQAPEPAPAKESAAKDKPRTKKTKK